MTGSSDCAAPVAELSKFARAEHGMIGHSANLDSRVGNRALAKLVAPAPSSFGAIYSPRSKDAPSG
jgi:hypothetical protein